jgi:hypothetical protein
MGTQRARRLRNQLILVILGGMGSLYLCVVVGVFVCVAYVHV